MNLNRYSEQEANKLLHTISLYKTLRYQQLIRLFPAEKEDAVNMLIRRLIRLKRLYYDQETDCVSVSEDLLKTPDKNVITAFWVLLDFMHKTEFHTISEYPVQISLFSAGAAYEIIHIPAGREAMVCYALKQSKTDAKKLIIIDSTEQIKEIALPDIACFCIVTEDKIEYFKQNKGAL